MLRNFFDENFVREKVEIKENPDDPLINRCKRQGWYKFKVNLTKEKKVGSQCQTEKYGLVLTRFSQHYYIYEKKLIFVPTFDYT